MLLIVHMTLQPGEYDIWVSFNNPIDVGLFDFGLTMQMNKVLGYVYYQLMDQLWACICISLMNEKISLSYVVLKFKIWYF